MDESNVHAEGEILGERCIDGGTCHHMCKERCFRRECRAPFSDYDAPWAYAEPVEAQPKPDYWRDLAVANRKVADQALAEVERLTADLVNAFDTDLKLATVCQQEAQIKALRAHLAERDALIAEVLEAFKLDAEGPGACNNPGLSFIRPWAQRVALLSAGAEPGEGVKS